MIIIIIVIVIVVIIILTHFGSIFKSKVRTVSTTDTRSNGELRLRSAVVYMAYMFGSATQEDGHRSR